MTIYSKLDVLVFAAGDDLVGIWLFWVNILLRLGRKFRQILAYDGVEEKFKISLKMIGQV